MTAGFFVIVYGRNRVVRVQKVAKNEMTVCLSCQQQGKECEKVKYLKFLVTNQYLKKTENKQTIYIKNFRIGVSY